MKKKNLNFLLALLAALALVFAGACSDGSDDTSGTTPSDNNSPTVNEDTFSLSTALAGTTWTYTSGQTSGSNVLESVTLVFNSDNTVTATAVGNSVSDAGSPLVWDGKTTGSENDFIGIYLNTSAIKWSASASTVTLSWQVCSAETKDSGSYSPSTWTDYSITLSLDSATIAAGALIEGDSEKDVAASYLTVGTLDTPTPSLTFYKDDTKIGDIFSSTDFTTGAVAANAKFEYTVEDDD